MLNNDICQSSAKNTINHATDSAVFCRVSYLDSDRYRVNSIHIIDNDNLSNNVHDPTNLGDSSLCYVLDVVRNASNFKTNSFLLIMH